MKDLGIEPRAMSPDLSSCTSFSIENSIKSNDTLDSKQIESQIKNHLNFDTSSIQGTVTNETPEIHTRLTPLNNHEGSKESRRSRFQVATSDSLSSAKWKKNTKPLNLSIKKGEQVKIRMPYFNSKGNVMDFDAHSDQEDNARTKNMLIDEATLP